MNSTCDCCLTQKQVIMRTVIEKVQMILKDLMREFEVKIKIIILLQMKDGERCNIKIFFSSTMVSSAKSATQVLQVLPASNRKANRTLKNQLKKLMKIHSRLPI